MGLKPARVALTLLFALGAWGCRWSQKVKVLVPGDKKDLLVMHPYQGSAVLGLRAFVDGFRDYL